jgi:hypothetical protein
VSSLTVTGPRLVRPPSTDRAIRMALAGHWRPGTAMSRGYTTASFPSAPATSRGDASPWVAGRVARERRIGGRHHAPRG